MAASQRPSIVARRPYQTIGVVVALLLVAYVATQFVEVLFTVFAGILLAVFFAGISRALAEGTVLPRPLALLLSVIGLVGIIVGLWAIAGPDISEQVNALAALLPDAAERLARQVRRRAQEY
ncbi:MAG: AI-2E family transporter, partial [Bacteroidetes bacterium QH_2_63_10]